MADYDLGTAHGKVVIDYNDRGSNDAVRGFQRIEDQAQRMGQRLYRLRNTVSDFGHHFGEMAGRASRNFALISAGAAGLAVATGAIRGLSSAVLGLNGGMNIVNALGVTLNGLPDNVSRFPWIIKQIILLSSAITLFGTSTRILGLIQRRMNGVTGVAMGLGRLGGRALGAFRNRLVTLLGLGPAIGFMARRFGALGAMVSGMAGKFGLIPGATAALNRLIGKTLELGKSSEAVRRFSAAFPELTTRLQKLRTEGVPNIRLLGDSVNRWTKPIHTIASMALALGTLFQAVRGVRQLAKAIGGLSGAIYAMVGASKIIMGLVAALKQLSGLVGLLPGLAFSAAAGIGTLVIGFQGFGEALKNMDDLEKFNEALENLAPAAAETARTIRGLRDRFTDLRKSVQQRLFEGMAQEVQVLADTYFPILREQLGYIAGAFNGIAKSISAFLKEAQTISDIDSGLHGTHAIIENLGAAIRPLLQAFRDIGIVGMEVFENLTIGAGAAAERFAAFVAEARKTGKLKEWIQGGVQAFRDLIAIVRNVGGILGAVFGALSGPQENFLSNLRASTGALRDFLTVGEGAETLQSLGQMFQEIAAITQEVLTVAFKELGPVIIELMPFIRDLAQVFGETLIVAIRAVAPLLEGIAKALSALSPVITPVLGSLLALGLAMSKAKMAFRAFSFILGPLAGGINIVALAARGLKAGLGLLLKGFMKLTPIGRIISIIAAIGFAIYELWTTNEDFRNWVYGAWDSIKNAISDAAEWIKGAWNGVVEFFQNLPTTIGTALDNLVTWFWELPGKAGEALAGFGTMLWETFTAAGQAMWDAFSQAGQAVLNWFWELPGKIAEFLMNLPQMLWDLFLQAVHMAGQAIGFGIGVIVAMFVGLPMLLYEVIVTFGPLLWQWFKDAWDWAVNAFHTGVNALVEWFAALPERINLAVATLGAKLWQWATDTWTAAKDRSIELATQLLDWLRGLPDRIVNGVNSLRMKLWNWAFDAWNSAKNRTIEIAQGIVNWLRGLPDRIINGISSLRMKLWNWAFDAWNSAKDAVIRKANEIVAWVKGLPQRIRNALGNLRGLLADAGRQIMDSLLSGIKDGFRWVQNYVGGIADKIRSLKGPERYDKRLLINAGKLIMDGLRNGLTDQFRKVEQTVRAMGPKIAQLLRSDKVAGLINSAINGLPNEAVVRLGNQFSAAQAARGLGAAATYDPGATTRAALRNGLAATATGGTTTSGGPMIGTVNMPIEHGLSTQQLVDRLMFETRRVSKGVYQ